MRFVISILTASILATACSSSPPKPPLPTGDFRPVNQSVAKTAGLYAPGRFDFSFEGDVSQVLQAISAKQPQLTVQEPRGQRVPVPVRLTLLNASLDQVMASLAEQGRGHFEVVYQRSAAQQTNTVFLRYNGPGKRQ